MMFHQAWNTPTWWVRVFRQSYGGHGERETPGPIPNPEVKPFSADGTATERLWESRTPPDNFSVGATIRWPLRCIWAVFVRPTTRGDHRHGRPASPPAPHRQGQ